jgi:hypothetical protein
MFEFAYRGGVHRGSATMRRHVEPPPLQLEQQIAPVLRALAGAIGDNDVHFGSAVTSHQSLDSGCGVAAMRIFILSGMIALALSASAHARAQPSNTALFDFEMIDTSLDGEMYGLRRTSRTGSSALVIS